MNYALLGWAEKLKKSKCWWGQCVLVMRAVFRICGNESQPGLQIVEKQATSLDLMWALGHWVPVCTCLVSQCCAYHTHDSLLRSVFNVASVRAKWRGYVHSYISCFWGVDTTLFCAGTKMLLLVHQVWTASLIFSTSSLKRGCMNTHALLVHTSELFPQI